jgi:hypothetical protein
LFFKKIKAGDQASIHYVFLYGSPLQSTKSFLLLLFSCLLPLKRKNAGISTWHGHLSSERLRLVKTIYLYVMAREGAKASLIGRYAEEQIVI